MFLFIYVWCGSKFLYLIIFIHFRVKMVELYTKVTIRHGFSWTVPILNDASRKKQTILSGRPFFPIFGLVSRICTYTDRLRYLMQPAVPVRPLRSTDAPLLSAART